MEISGETLVHEAGGFAAMTYQERQRLDSAVTDRFSTVLMMDRGVAPRSGGTCRRR